MHSVNNRLVHIIVSPAVILLTVIAICYVNSLGNGLHFDDWHVIEKNPAIRSLAQVPGLFTNPHAMSVLRSNIDLRPLLMTTFALNYAVSGLAPWSYHLLNVVLHWAVVLLVFRITRDLLWLGDDRRAVAWIAALLVAVHPLGTETMNYLSARSALLATLCYLASFDRAVRGRTLAASAYAALAMLTKAIAATLPLVVLAYAAVDRGRRRDERPPMPWRTVAALGAVVAGGIAYRLLVLPPWALAATHDPSVSGWTYALTSASAYLYYLRLFAWPDALVVDRVDYPLMRSIADPRAAASLVVLAAVSVLAWRVRRRWPALMFAWAWFLVTLLPEQSVFPLAEPVNEHRAYLPMLGLAVAAAIGVRAFAALAARIGAARASVTVPLTAAVVTVALASVTIARNRVWADDYQLWIDATRKAPLNPRAWLNAGHAAMNRGRLDEAERMLAEAHRLGPCYAFVQLNQSALAARRGRGAESLARAREAVACQPRFALAHQYVGAALERAGRDAEAIGAYRRALAIDERLLDAWRPLAQLYARAERWPDAAAAFERIAALDPTDTAARVEAGVIQLRRLHDPARAVAYFRDTLAINPEHYGARYQLAVALLAAGEARAARSEWQRFAALARDQGHPEDLAAAPQPLRDGDAADRDASRRRR